MEYTPPKIVELGTVRELTQQKVNKVGKGHDQFSNQSPLVGTLVPVP